MRPDTYTGSGTVEIDRQLDEIFNISPNPQPRLRDMMAVFWYRRRVIFGFAILLSLASVAICYVLTPEYTAQAKIMISPRQENVVKVTEVLSALSGDFESVQSEIFVLQSRDLAQKVIDQLALRDDPEFNRTLRRPARAYEIFSVLDDSLHHWAADFGILASGDASAPHAPASSQEADGAPRSPVVDEYLRHLQVAPEGKSRVITVSFTSESAGKAAVIANAISDAYIKSQVLVKSDATARANEWLLKRVAELSRQVHSDEAAVEAFKKEWGLLQGKGEANLNDQEAMERARQLVIARTKRQEAEAKLSNVEQSLRSPDRVDTLADVLGSPFIQHLRAQEAEALKRQAQLLSTYGLQHPQMVQVSGEIAEIRSGIRQEIAKIVQSLRNQVAIARAQEGAEQDALAGLKRGILQKGDLQIRLHSLEQEAEATQEVYKLFLQRYKETSAQENLALPDAAIISHANVPENPSFPRRWLIIIIGTIGGVATGVGAGLVREHFDRGVRSLAQVERNLGVGVLGIIPALRHRRQTRITSATQLLDRAPRSEFVEALRALYTTLCLATPNPPRLVLVSSGLPSEGKTSTVLSLAAVARRAGRRVLIIDCDIYKPSIHRAFNAPVTPGLAEYLVGEAEANDIVRSTDMSTDIIPAGAVSEAPAMILGSERMAILLNSARDRYDLVLIDSAPVLAASDTRLVSRLVDATIYAVRWNDTPEGIARSGLLALIQAGAHVPGVVLSMVDVSHGLYGRVDGKIRRRLRKYYSGSKVRA
jgi:capsular exopolysaccharide synthesis family protein